MNFKLKWKVKRHHTYFEGRKLFLLTFLYLHLEALLATGVHHSRWDCNSAMTSVLSGQHEEGHFGNLAATIHIMPLLAGRHHSHIKELEFECPEGKNCVDINFDTLKKKCFSFSAFWIKKKLNANFLSLYVCCSCCKNLLGIR